MALIQTGLIWVAYAVAIVILLAIASVFVFVYQTPRDRSASVTTVCIITTSALLATILLLPVDVALVSSTTRSSTGARKDWASQDRVDSIVFTLKVVYYTLYSLDAVLCLLVCPFTYFYYEEYDERATEEGSQTLASRLLGALKYTSIFVALVLIIFLFGFFVPVAAQGRGHHRDLDFFKDLLTENHGERALTFAIGLLITIGTLLYVLYTGAGLALLPVTMVKSAPSVSAPTFAANTQHQLEQNRERQHQLESRNQGRAEDLDPRDRRELEALVREERTLNRRERLANESVGEGQHWLIRSWTKFCAILRPIKLVAGILIMLVALVIWVSMLITGIDKAKNSICKTRCGYLLAHINIFQPINWVFVRAAKVFPIDYILFLLVVILFFSGSVVGLAVVGIRFLWLTLFKIQSGRTSPQALLMATVMLTLMVLAINYAIAMLVAPQYATYGPQTYCDLPITLSGKAPDCSKAPGQIKACSELAENAAASKVCTPSVVSTFINRTMLNFPFFGVVAFWAQFAFLAVFLVTFATSLVRTPKLDTSSLDARLEEDEEEGLLAGTGRRFQATWQDITGRARKNNPDYGTVQGESSTT